MRLDCYIRVSDLRGREGDRFISPDVQHDACEGWAARHDAEIVKVWPELDVSGGTIDRPMLTQVLDRIEHGLTDGIIVARQDRFARTLLGGLEAIERIRAAGGTFVSVAENFDLTVPEGELMFHQMLAWAHFERQRIGQTWQTAKTRAAQRGVHLCAGSPFGYDRSEGGVLIPGVHALIVQAVFERRARGEGWGTIARWLDDQNIPTARGGNWGRNTIVAIIQNRVYLGEARGGGQVVTGAHQPLVDETLWHRANRVRGVRTIRAHDDAPALLVGIIRCAGCRYTLRRQPVISGRTHRLMTYECRKGRAGGCPSPAAIAQHFADQHLEELVNQRLTAGGVSRHTDAKLVDAQQIVANTWGSFVQWRDSLELQQELGDEYIVGLVARKRAHDTAVATAAEVAGIGQLPVLAEGVKLNDLPHEVQRAVIGAYVHAVFLRRSPRRGRIQDVPGRLLVVWHGDMPGLELPRKGGRLGPLGEIDW